MLVHISEEAAREAHGIDLAKRASQTVQSRGQDMASWVNRMIGAARLEVATYEEVKADPKATVQAITVVLLSAAASGTGSIRAGALYVYTAFGMTLAAWVAWAFLTWLIGTKFLAEAETKAAVGPLVRTTGFAASPGTLSALGWIPILGPVINILAWLWMLAATVVAVRQALNYKNTVRAVLVSVIAGVVLFTTYFVYMAVMIMRGGL